MVLHAAAYKHVPMMEHHPADAVYTNVGGTLGGAAGVARRRRRAVRARVTDKAVEPSSVMGATKRLAELAVAAVAGESGRPYVSVRFGNVLGSSGSVVPLFQRQLREGVPLTITDPEMTRYFMTIPEASRLILEASLLGEPGDLFVLDMGEPVRIVDLARDLARLAGRDPDSVPSSTSACAPARSSTRRCSTTPSPSSRRVTRRCSAPATAATPVVDPAEVLGRARRARGGRRDRRPRGGTGGAARRRWHVSIPRRRAPVPRDRRRAEPIPFHRPSLGAGRARGRPRGPRLGLADDREPDRRVRDRVRRVRRRGPCGRGQQRDGGAPPRPRGSRRRRATTRSSCPTYTFAASAEVVLYLGARPVLVDVDPDTRTSDPGAVAARDRPTHAGGRGRPHRGPAGRPAGDPRGGRRRARSSRTSPMPSLADRGAGRAVRRDDRPGRGVQLLRDEDHHDRRGRDARRPRTRPWPTARGRCACTASAATPGSATPRPAPGTTRSRRPGSRTT